MVFIKHMHIIDSDMQDNKDKVRTYDFLGQNYTFNEFVLAIKKFLMASLPDPKGEQIDRIVKPAIRKNGYENPDAFLNEYIWKKEIDGTDEDTFFAPIKNNTNI